MLQKGTNLVLIGSERTVYRVVLVLRQGVKTLDEQFLHHLGVAGIAVEAQPVPRVTLLDVNGSDDIMLVCVDEAFKVFGLPECS